MHVQLVNLQSRVRISPAEKEKIAFGIAISSFCNRLCVFANACGKSAALSNVFLIPTRTSCSLRLPLLQLFLQDIVIKRSLLLNVAQVQYALQV